MSRMLLAIVLCVMAFIAGWTLRMAAGQERATTPVGEPKGELFVFAFAQRDCPFCADMATSWKALEQEPTNHFELFTVQTMPGQFAVWGVKGTPTTIIGARTGELKWKREIFRIDGAMTMKQIEPLLARARAKIDVGLPDWPASISERLPLEAPAP
jgi:protein-disulfide isomerase